MLHTFGAAEQPQGILRAQRGNVLQQARAIGGGVALIHRGKVHLHALALQLLGQPDPATARGILPLVQVQQTAPVSTLEQAEALGTDVARRLQAGGAKVCTNA